MTNEERYAQAHTAVVESLRPSGDTEQVHLIDEIQHPELYDAVHHEFAVRCSNCGTTQPVTISFRELPEGAER